jgi:hypothetical protein
LGSNVKIRGGESGTKRPCEALLGEKRLFGYAVCGVCL